MNRLILVRISLKNQHLLERRHDHFGLLHVFAGHRQVVERAIGGIECHSPGSSSRASAFSM